MKLRLFSVITFGFIALALPVATLAQTNFRSADNNVLTQNEVIDRDYFATGEQVSIDGTVNGDTYAAGSSVTVNGTINGDLLVAGGMLNINGQVLGNIRVAGGNITINGNVGRNVTAVGGSITISPNTQIGGSVTTAGGNINLLGPIAKEANVAGGQLNIDNSVGDVHAAIGKLTLSSRAKVNGNVTYWSDEKATISQQAVISGNVTQNIPSKMQQSRELGEKTAAGFFTAFKIISFLTALIFGLLLLKLFPNYTLGLSQTAKNKWLPSLGIGFLTLAVTPFAVILLLVTIVGMPFAVLWIFGLVFSLWLAKIFIALAIGTSIAAYFKRKWTANFAFLLGLLIYYAIGLLPVVGWLFSFITTLIGFGALVITKKQYYRELQKKKLL